MVNKTSHALIKNILDLIASIEEILANKDITLAMQDKTTIWACISLLIHIGEAIVKLHKIDPNAPLSNMSAIIGMRNIMAHDYLTIRTGYIQRVCVEHMPILKQECIAVLHSEDVVYGPHSIELRQ